MLDWTDRYCRYFLRLFSKHILLYSEMLTTGAILHGDREHLLQFDPQEHPLAIQLGGSHPRDLAECAKITTDYGYDEVNLNVGCPSDRVQSGRFGACLMAEPNLVAEGVAAMSAATHLPITVKTRIGIDNQDSYAELRHFIDTVAGAGCDTFIIHARKAWLQGLSPKENREIPPLRYDVAAQLKQDFPQLTIILNGGITSLDQAIEHLATFDGVMLGRAAYHNPYILAEVDQRLFNSQTPALSRQAIVQEFLPFVAEQLSLGIPLARIIRHTLGLFQGQPGARAFRRYLSEHMFQRDADITVLTEALKQIPTNPLI